MNRCADPSIGVKVLSYDLLQGDEKASMDAHLQVCAVCRDLRQQTYGKEGALDELAYRVYKLSQRRAVEAHAWVLERLRDLAVPFTLFLFVLLGVAYILTHRDSGPEPVRILHLAITRAGTLDSLSPILVPRISPNPNALLVRPDRLARAYVYETRGATLRRILPGGDAPPPQLSPERTEELRLPDLDAPESRLLLVLVPRDAPGTTTEWDDAVFRRLGGQRADGSASAPQWPRGVAPTLRWVP